MQNNQGNEGVSYFLETISYQIIHYVHLQCIESWQISRK